LTLTADLKKIDTVLLEVDAARGNALEFTLRVGKMFPSSFQIRNDEAQIEKLQRDTQLLRRPPIQMLTASDVA
jgi:hypothetical protein